MRVRSCARGEEAKAFAHTRSCYWSTTELIRFLTLWSYGIRRRSMLLQYKFKLESCKKLGYPLPRSTERAELCGKRRT